MIEVLQVPVRITLKPSHKTRARWREAIGELPVFDTHTHMNNPGVPIGAQNVWDIVHYFWFQQELWSVGYPPKPMEQDEDERIDRFVGAFNQVRNTVWASGATPRRCWSNGSWRTSCMSSGKAIGSVRPTPCGWHANGFTTRPSDATAEVADTRCADGSSGDHR